jgi:hypothetical protein
VQRSSETIGTIAAALAKAQAQLVNPEKTLVGTIRSEQGTGSERSFRYAPLSSGLDIVHLRFAQRAALGRKVSDEFTVPLCRGHHREVHHCGDEASWWEKAGIDPTVSARQLWLKTHPLQPRTDWRLSGDCLW